MKEKDKSIKVFFTSKLFIFHKERNIKKFLLQRMVFGSDLFNIIKFGNKINSFQPILPLIIAISFCVIIFAKIDLFQKFFLLGIYFSIIELAILLDLKKYLKNFKTIFLSLIMINLANIFYVLGNLMAIFAIKNLLNRKFYLKSRQNS